MKVQFQNNSLSVSHLNKFYQLHPVWLRERLPGEEYFDIDTHQRLYEPSSIDLNLQITSAILSDYLLNILMASRKRAASAKSSSFAAFSIALLSSLIFLCLFSSVRYLISSSFTFNELSGSAA